MIKNKISLSVIKGINNGSVLTLSEGIHTIGSQLTHDIIISDPSFDNKFATLEIKDDGEIFLTTTDFPEANLNGKSTENKVQKVIDGDVFDFCSTRLVIKIEHPIIENKKTAGIDNKAETPHGQSLEKIAIKANPEEVEPIEHIWATKELGGHIETMIRSLRNSLKNASNEPLKLLGIGFFSVGISLAVTSKVFGFDSDKNPPLSSGNLSKIEQSLADNGFKNIIFSQKEYDNSRKISGHVNSSSDYNRLTKIINSSTNKIIIDVFIKDDVITKAEDIINQYDIKDISIDMESNETYIATGFIKDRTQWETVKKKILADIPRIRHINDENIDTINTRLISLDKLTKLNGLKDKITFNSTSGEIIHASGILEGKELFLWNEVKRVFNEKYHFRPIIEDDVRDISSELGLSITSISSGKHPSIQASNGLSYFEGAFLPSGYKILSIERNNITVSMNDEKFNYKL